MLSEHVCRTATATTPALTQAGGVQAGTAHWPYTWADCEMVYAFNLFESGGSYCNGNHEHTVDCSGQEMSANEIEAYLKDMSTSFDDGPLRTFQDNARKWEHYVNKGLNKMTAAGATWGRNAVRIAVPLSRRLHGPLHPCSAVLPARLATTLLHLCDCAAALLQLPMPFWGR